MHSVADTIRHIGEKSTERMNCRTKPRTQQSAALSGMDDSTFTLNAYQAALATINSHERTALAPVDHAAFLRLWIIRRSRPRR